MLKTILSTVTGLVLLIAVVGYVSPTTHAYNTLDVVCRGNGASNSSVCKEKDNTENPLVGPNGILTRVIQIIIYVIAVVSVIVIIIAGLRFITAQGDPSKISSARSSIIYAIVGLVVAVLAQIIVLFILKRV